MKNSTVFGKALIVLIACIPLLFLASIYSSLPETVPIHFGTDGKANGFAGKSTLWFTSLLLCVVSLGLYLLITNLQKIDPKKTAGQSPALYKKIATLLVIFFCAINLLSMYAAMGGNMKVMNLFLPFTGLFFLALGNYMHSIKPNYFVGFRLPWTLESEDNWRKTHQLVGKIWVPGGLLITIGTLLLPPKPAYTFFISVVACMVIIPCIYSYRYFKSHQQN